jgi:hypothetical protein
VLEIGATVFGIGVDDWYQCWDCIANVGCAGASTALLWVYNSEGIPHFSRAACCFVTHDAELFVGTTLSEQHCKTHMP